MLFNSAEFLFIFLPLSLIGYFALGRVAGKASRIWLCIASLVFYTWWEPAFLVVLLCSILFNFGISLLIWRSKGQASLAWLIVGIAGNLGALGYYKYAQWLVSLAIDLGIHAQPLSDIILPLGISFFTFTQIGYLIDVKNDVAKERGFVNYVLFVTFFPHLIAGPILHHREIMPQFADRLIDRFNLRHFVVGLTVFLLGLFKKTVIADGISPLVASGFAQGPALGAGGAWLTILAYTLQLYFDFSGYSDMAVGLARMFNVRFPLNFNSPLKAQNISDFWQRWHMTLTRYLTAYLYNPVAIPLTRRVLAGDPSAAKRLTTAGGFGLTVALPTIWTMTLAGIWHGAGAQFVIFGLLHSFYIVVHRAWATWGPKRRKFKKGMPIDLRERMTIAVAVAITTLCWAVSLVFFRSPNVPVAMDMLRAMAGLGTGVARNTGYMSTGAEVVAIACLFVVVWLAPNVYEVMGSDNPALTTPKGKTPNILTWRPSPAWAAIVGLVGAAAVVAIGQTTEFLYFQF